MYETHFGLSKRPFGLTPDTELFVNLADHQLCFSLIQHALNSGEGFVKIIGDVGCGKTILCRKLLSYLETKNQAATIFHTVYIPNPMLSPIGLYRAVAKELGVAPEAQRDNDAVLEAITERIITVAQQNQTVVIVVDEAQSLPAGTLEALRLISNLETEQKKLAQIIMFGQTELDDVLKQERFRQLRQRITFSHYLKKMTAADTEQYIQFRLTQSGYNGPGLFAQPVIKRLHQLTEGTPRLVNIVAHKSLMAAFADNQFTVTTKHVNLAAQDSDLAKASFSINVAPWFAGAAAVSLALALVWRVL